MSIVIASDDLSNTAEIAISGKGQLPLDENKLKNIGLLQSLQYWNYAFIINNHSSAIKVRIGKDIQYIGAGSAFEWGQDKRVNFVTIEIEEVGGASVIDIGDIIANVSRLR